MKIPSYDDLTPGISHVHPRDTFDQATRLVTCHEPVVTSPPPSTAPARPAELYACLRVRRAPLYGPPAARQKAAARHGARAPQKGAMVPHQGVPYGVDEALYGLARDFSPRIECQADGSVVLDVSGLGRLLGDAQGIAGELQKAAVARGLSLRIAVAPTQIAAQLLTRDPADDAPRAVTGDVAGALARLPLKVLEDHIGVPSRTFDALHRWGIRSVGEFAALPPDELAARFGQEGIAIQRMARGEDARPLIADPGVQRFVESLELEWPIEALEPLSFVFARLLDPLSTALERAGKAGAAIRLDLRLVDRTVHSRMLQLPAPMRDPRVLRTLLTLDLESHPPAAGIDVVTIEIDPAPSRIVQFSLLERAIPSPETLTTLTARLHALVGETRCGSPVLLDSHRPDAFEMARFNPDDSASAKASARQAETQKTASRHDSPTILRRFRPPVAVRVTCERGRPVKVAVDRKGMPGGRVQQYSGPWRSSGAWWDGTAHWDRDEWDVALSDGAVCRLFRDRVTGTWFVDGVID
jgi:protein ImuB